MPSTRLASPLGHTQTHKTHPGTHPQKCCPPQAQPGASKLNVPATAHGIRRPAAVAWRTAASRGRDARRAAAPGRGPDAMAPAERPAEQRVGDGAFCRVFAAGASRSTSLTACDGF